MASTIRSFIAVDLTPQHKRSLGKVIKGLAEKWPEYRWCDPDQLHLTLNFLGPVPDDKIPDVCNIMRETVSKHAPFGIDLEGIGAFPKISRPRVIWAGIGEGKSPLSRIYYDLRHNLDDLRLERDGKAFRPHITLGRIRKQERWPDSMIEYLESQSEVDLGSADVSEVVLFSSFEEAAGPVYTAMDRARLKRSKA